jgi:hypothetical protein
LFSGAIAPRSALEKFRPVCAKLEAFNIHVLWCAHLHVAGALCPAHQKGAFVPSSLLSILYFHHAGDLLLRKSPLRRV